jgi:hypothetical protein
MKWRIWGLRSNGTENRYKGLDGQNSIQNSSFRVHAAFREKTNHQNGVIVDRHVISCNILSLSNVRIRVLIKPVFCSIAPQTRQSGVGFDPDFSQSPNDVGCIDSSGCFTELGEHKNPGASPPGEWGNLNASRGVPGSFNPGSQPKCSLSTRFFMLSQVQKRIAIGHRPSNLLNPRQIQMTFNGLSEGEARLRRVRERSALVRKPDASKSHIRFDERDLETEETVRYSDTDKPQGSETQLRLNLTPPRQISTLPAALVQRPPALRRQPVFDFRAHKSDFLSVEADQWQLRNQIT